MTQRSAVVTATKINLIGNLFAPAAALLSAPILAQALGVEGRGQLAAAVSPLMLGVAALTVGLPEGATFLTARARVVDASVSRVLKVSLFGIGLVSAAVLALAVPYLGAGAQVTALMWLALTCLPPALLLTGLRGEAAGLGLWWRIAYERILTSGLRLLALLCLLVTDRLTVVTATVVLSASMCVGALAYVGAFRGRSGRAYPRIQSPVRQLYGFGLRHWSGALAGAMLSRIDQLLMVPLSDPANLGLYVVAVSISEAAIVVNLAIRDVMFSVESGERNPERLAAAARLSTLVTTILALGIALVALPALPLLFGEEFAGAYPVLLVLLAGVVIGNPGSICGAGMSGWGRPDLRSRSMVASAVINVVAVVLLVPAWGALGAAVATFIGGAAAGLLNTVWCKRTFGIAVSEFYLVRPRDVATVARELAAVARRLVSRS